ncbi:MAG TPA: DNA topoisomerase I [Nitrososphaeraceae archaeon]|jgi:DNA topoisomerase-1|nr:DNA topoisomerase I [Nitrososphaeraceae archaeon]
MGKTTKPYTLVICEKPDVARRIAYALGTSNSLERSQARGPSSFFDITSYNSQQRFVICAAIGHMYSLIDATNHRATYPVFDLEWTPTISKSGRPSRVKRIIETISYFSKNATNYVHACDYDQEGEIIGYNILEYACKGKYGKSQRAKISTLTNEDIKKSFDNLLEPNKGLAEAGKSRHIIDFIYGINLSRALSQSYKKNSNDNDKLCHNNLSIGRVQGPTLAFITNIEHQIRKHIPDPYWSVLTEFQTDDGYIIKTHYEHERIRILSEASSILNGCKGKNGQVNEIKNQESKLLPPHPFSLGDLQKEAYILFKISPSHTLTIAQTLYLDALISYPRTSSQKLPPSIGYKKIFSRLAAVSADYAGLTQLFCNQYHNLSPNEGKKNDPAHSAIYPTGQKPSTKLQKIEFKIYDLIVRRFLATFANPSINLRTIVSIKINDYIFNTEGKIQIYEGWTQFYKPYFRSEMLQQLPELHKDEILKNNNVSMIEKFIQPPRRFNQATLLEKMEKDQIGTKTTRANIINTLFKRNYITIANHISRKYEGEWIEATDPGFAIIEAIGKYVPNILSVDLTRSMERDLEKIEKGKSSDALVIEKAADRLIKSLMLFKKNEANIGKHIAEAFHVSHRIKENL